MLKITEGSAYGDDRWLFREPSKFRASDCELKNTATRNSYADSPEPQNGDSVLFDRMQISSVSCKEVTSS